MATSFQKTLLEASANSVSVASAESSTTDASGHIYNAGSKVICARNFTLSGNTLYITST